MGRKGFRSAVASKSCLVVYFGYFSLSQQQVLLPLFYSTFYSPDYNRLLVPCEFVSPISVLPWTYKHEKNL